MAVAAFERAGKEGVSLVMIDKRQCSFLFHLYTH